MSNTTHLGRNLALAQQLSHQTVLDIAIASALLEVILGQEHVPQAELLSLLLQLFHHDRSSLPSLLALAELGGEYGVGGDTVLLDELLDLGMCLAWGCSTEMGSAIYQVEGLLSPVADEGLSDRGDTGRGRHGE